MGNANRAPTADELKKMEELVEQGMKDGAWGLATGLIYNPGTYAKTDELIALAKVAAQARRASTPATSATRATGLLDAIEEAMTHRPEAGLPRPHLAHQGVGQARVGQVGRRRRADRDGPQGRARASPPTSTRTSPAAPRCAATLVPAQVPRGHDRRTSSPASTTRDRARRCEGRSQQALGGRDGGKRIRIARYAPKPDWQGKDLAAIAEAEKKEPLDIVLEIERNGGAQIVNFGMSEEDVRLYHEAAVGRDRQRRQRAGCPATRCRTRAATAPSRARSAATPSRTRSSRSSRRSAAPAACRPTSSKLTDRGYLKPGYFADVVVFDPKTFRDTATFDKPHQYATGVKWLFVNGHAAIADGEPTEARAGRVLAPVGLDGGGGGAMMEGGQFPGRPEGGT